MKWTQKDMEALGQQLIAGLQVPDGTELTTYADQDPGRIMFVARRAGHAGSTAVSVNALEDFGPGQASIALDELLRVVRVDGLPRCSASETSPLLGCQTSSGWRTA